MPAGKVAAIGARERAGAKTADGRALPIAVVNVAGVQRGLLGPWIFERSADGAFPGGFGDIVAGLGSKSAGQNKENESKRQGPSKRHEASKRVKIRAIA